MTRVYEVPGTKLSVFADAVGGKDEGLHAIGHLRMMCTMATRWAAAPGSRYRAGHGTQLLEEDLAMSDRMPEPGNAGDQRGSEPDMSGTAEFAKMRAVMRASEKHREGGVDPELEDADADPAPDT